MRDSEFYVNGGEICQYSSELEKPEKLSGMIALYKMEVELTDMGGVRLTPTPSSRCSKP